MKINVPPISLVIPTRGAKGEELTEALLSSLYDTHAHMRDAIEVIVVQDGDDSEAEASLRRRLEDFPKVNVVVNDKPGFSRACNVGLIQSSGAWVFLCNNDILFEDPCLQKLFAFGMSANAGVVAPLLLYPDRTVQHAGVFYHKPHPELNGYFDHIGRNENEYSPNAISLRVGLVTGALFGISRGALDAVGLLDERYGFSCEDVDYCLRCFEMGLTVYYCGLAHAFHLEGASRGRTVEEKMRMAPDIAVKESEALRLLHEKWIGVDFSSFNPR